MARFIALLRAVNVGGRKLPMGELRELCGELGWTDVETYIQSGNVVFAAAGGRDALERKLEEAIRSRFGLDVPVIVRSASDWRAYVESNPFPLGSEKEPNRVLMGLAKSKPKAGAAEALQERAAAGETVRSAGDALWFHYPAGAGTSKLTPSLIDRTAGSPVTARNWRTVRKLAELAS